MKVRKGINRMLYIMRHGKTDWNEQHKLQGRTDIPLNENGIAMAKKAAEEYGKHLISLIAAHEMYLRSLMYLRERKEHLEDLDADMEQIRYDLFEIQKEIRIKKEVQTSIQEQLRLTD